LFNESLLYVLVSSLLFKLTSLYNRFKVSIKNSQQTGGIDVVVVTDADAAAAADAEVRVGDDFDELLD